MSSVDGSGFDENHFDKPVSVYHFHGRASLQGLLCFGQKGSPVPQQAIFDDIEVTNRRGSSSQASRRR